MFGFVKSDRVKKSLGGEVIRKKKKMQKILFIILGTLAFAVFNLILYSLTHF